LDTQATGRRDGDSNWGRWGEDDQSGAGNLLTPAVVRAAAESVSEGRVISLALPIDARLLPQFAGRPSVIHTLRLDAGDYLAGARALDDVKSSDDHLFLSLHGVTHVDALAHTWYGDHLYNGFPQAQVRSSGARSLGAEQIAPMVTRGVLVDCVSFLPSPPRPGDSISRGDIETVLEAEGVELRSGDVVLVRTGWLRDWRAASLSDDLVEHEQGLAADTAGLWIENDVVGIGTEQDRQFVLVRRDIAGELQPVERQLLRGRRVEDHRHAEAMAETQRCLDRFQRDLHLYQHRVGARDQRVRTLDLYRRDPCIGRRHHDDLVLAGGDGDRGGAAGAVVEPGGVGEVDAFGGQALEQLLGERIIANGADECHLGAESRRGHGLVCTLAAGHGEKALAEDGLAGADKTRRLRDQIHIDAADDDDAGHDIPRR